MGSSKVLRVFAILAVFIGLAMVGMQSVSAGEAEATLTIHKAECFSGVGASIFEECHDDGVGDVAFEVNGDVFVADSAGVLTLNGPAGDVTITEDPDVFGAGLGAYVFCRDLTDDEVLFDGSATDSGGTITISVAVGDEVVCDWYNITAAASSGTGTTTTTTLPATGTGVGSTNSQLVILLGLVGSLMALGLGLRKRSAF